MVTQDVVVEALREVYDPELHYNIYDLGLVYDIGIKDGDVHILMTLTTPACPIGPMVVEQIEETVGLMPGVRNVDVEFTFEPPWTPERMSDEARADLGLDYGYDPHRAALRRPHRHRNRLLRRVRVLAPGRLDGDRDMARLR